MKLVYEMVLELEHFKCQKSVGGHVKKVYNFVIFQ